MKWRVVGSGPDVEKARKMDNGTHSETADISITIKPKDSWDKQISSIRKSGARKAREIRKQGHQFHVEILGPREVQVRDSFPLAAVQIKLDWKIETRIKLVEAANDMIANAYLIDSLDPAFPVVLKSLIEGRGLYEHGIGEFFLLYGQFQEKHKLSKGTKTKDKMVELLKGDTRHLKPYWAHGKWSYEPLPYAVRNILSHLGSNPNNLDRQGNDLRTSIDLLKSWVARE